MLFKDVTFVNPVQNILFDDVLLDLAERGQSEEVFRLWESPSVFIVLGRVGKAEEDLQAQEIKAERIPVLRRSSGGGTVLQGPGCLNFSFVLSKEKDPRLNDLRRSYQIILEKVIAVFAALGQTVAFRPISDLALVPEEKKFSGNAQKRGKKFILHHGTILYNFDLSLIAKYLTIPRDIPEYRRNRAHLDFVCNIPCSTGQIAQAFGQVLGVPAADPHLTAVEQQRLDEFVAQRDVLVRL